MQYFEKVFKFVILFLLLSSFKIYASTYDLINEGKLEVIKGAFLNKTLDLNSSCFKNKPLIVCAVELDQIDIVDFLLSQGADVHYRDSSGETLLYHAIMHAYDDLKMVRFLETKGLDLNTTKKYLFSSLGAKNKTSQKLFYRWSGFSSEFIETMIPFLSMAQKEELYMNALERHRYPLCKLLVEAGVDVNIKDKNENTVLHHLSAKGDLALLEWFLLHNADVNRVNLKEKTPLEIAFLNNNYEAVKRLLHNDVDTTRLYNGGGTLLHLAVKTKNIKIIKLILPYIENIDKQDDQGNTALHIAAGGSPLDIVKYLTAHHAKLDIKNNNDVTPRLLLLQRKDIDSNELALFKKKDTLQMGQGIKPYIFFSHEIKSIVMIPKENKFVVNDRFENIIYIWDMKHFVEIKKLTLPYDIDEMKYIPKTSYLAIKNKDGIAIYDLKSEATVMKFDLNDIRDYEVALSGKEIYIRVRPQRSYEDKFFLLDMEQRKLQKKDNIFTYILNKAHWVAGENQTLVNVNKRYVEIYNFKQKKRSSYNLDPDQTYRLKKFFINHDNDWLVLYKENTKDKIDIFLKQNEKFVKVDTLQSDQTENYSILMDSENDLLSVIDKKQNKLYRYSKQTLSKPEVITLPEHMKDSIISIWKEQLISFYSPSYGALIVSLFDIRSKKTVLSKKAFSEDIPLELFASYLDVKKANLQNTALYKRYEKMMSAEEHPALSYVLWECSDGSKYIREKRSILVKKDKWGTVIFRRDTKHKYSMQFRIDQKHNTVATWSESTGRGEIFSDDFVLLIDATTGKVKKKIQVKKLVAFGFAGDYFFTQSSRKPVPNGAGLSLLVHGPISLYNGSSGVYVKSVDLPNKDLKINSLSHTKPYMAFDDIKRGKSFVNVFDLEKGESIAYLERYRFSPTVFTPDDRLIYKNKFNKFVLFDLNEKKDIYLFKEMLLVPHFINPKIMAFLTSPGKVSLYDYRMKKKLADAITFRDGWIIITPEGYFTGGGNFADKISFLDTWGNIYDTNQIYDGFFRPDLVKLKLDGSDINVFLHDTVLENALKNPPPKLLFGTVENQEVNRSEFMTAFFKTDRKKVKITFEVKENGGGVGLIRIYQEGKLIKTIGKGKIEKKSANIDTVLEQEKLDALQKVKQAKYEEEQNKLHLASLASRSVTGELSIEETIAKPETKSIHNESGRYTIAVELRSGKNEISIEAFNKTNTVTSYRESITIEADIPKKKPKLYAIIAGVNTFESPSIKNLKYSENDAKAIKELVQQQMKTVFEDVNVTYLTGSDVTKENILNAAKEISEHAGLEDTVLFYISTHGRAARGKLYLVPYNNKSFRNWIDFGQMFKAIQSIKALKQLFVIDACESGKANDIVSSVYDSRASVLAKSSGVHMLLATTKGTYAFEHVDKNIKHGVFTYKILEALKEKTTDLNRDNMISVIELSKKLKEPGNNADYQYPVIRNVGNDISLERVK